MPLLIRAPLALNFPHFTPVCSPLSSVCSACQSWTAPSSDCVSGSSFVWVVSLTWAFRQLHWSWLSNWGEEGLPPPPPLALMLMVELRKAVPAWQTVCLGCPLPSPLLFSVSVLSPRHFSGSSKGMFHLHVTLAVCSSFLPHCVFQDKAL